jgi:uncharacterized protein (DUF488 family)
VSTLFTIGFTRTNARAFFTTLRDAGVKRVLDIRLHNSSQLAGFAKRDDLRYFLEAIAGIGYAHLPQLAPSQDLFDAYKNAGGPWEEYESGFHALLDARRVETLFRKRDFAGSCLLCACPTPAHCHRRLVAEFFAERFDRLRVVHLSPQTWSPEGRVSDNPAPAE